MILKVLRELFLYFRMDNEHIYLVILPNTIDKLSEFNNSIRESIALFSKKPISNKAQTTRFNNKIKNKVSCELRFLYVIKMLSLN